MDRLPASFIPPIALDSSSETPLYRQISTWFQRAILAGQLQPGQRVPSTRTLAEALGVSRNPVLGAYELLIAEGYFQPLVGAGTCISQSLPGAMLRPGRGAAGSPSAADAESKQSRAISRRAAGMSAEAQAWLDRSRGGCINVDHFPIGIWSKLVNRHARHVSRDVMGYGDASGHGPFREAVAEYLGAFRAVRCDASQILVTTGAQQGLLIAALALLDPNDGTWVEEPGYPALHQTLRLAGARILPVPVDREGMSVEQGIQNADQARAAFVTPSHQYPLSVTMSAPRRIELMSWAERTGGWIVEDDYDSEFRFSGNPIASLQGLDTAGRVIYLGTFTKVMFPAIRLGYMVVPKDLMPAFIRARNATDTLATPVSYQVAMTDFIREGHFSRYIKRMRAFYAGQRHSLLQAIAAHADGLLEVVGDDAGMHLMALLPDGVDDLEVVTRARQAGIRVNALSPCYVVPPARGGLLYHFTNIKVPELPAQLAVLTGIIRACRR